MDYEKKYNEALKWMCELYPGLHGATKEDAEHYFPELKESDDERIRKKMVEHFKSKTKETWCNIPVKDILKWLEKQKDHFRDDTKKVEKQDYSGLNDLERVIHRGFLSAGVENVPVTIIKETAQECLAQMKPAEWSEEDKKMRTNAVLSLMYLIEECPNADFIDSVKKEIAWLKSLRPQPHWKPSKKQINALKYTISYGGIYNKEVLMSLYKQLQKLGVKDEPEYYQHFDPDC